MRTKRYPTSPAFVIDVPNSDVDYGGHIDWDLVPNAAPYARPDGKKAIPAGTLMVTLDSGLRAPREVAPAGKTAQYITWNDIQQDSKEDSHRAYAMLIGGTFWSNLLAAHHVANANFQAWLTEFRQNGTGSVFKLYRDTRVG